MRGFNDQLAGRIQNRDRDRVLVNIHPDMLRAFHRRVLLSDGATADAHSLIQGATSYIASGLSKFGLAGLRPGNLAAIALRALRFSAGLRTALGRAWQKVWVLHVCCRRHSFSRENNRKRSTSTLSLRIGPNLDRTAILLNKLLADPQPKAGTDRPLRREERIEYPQTTENRYPKMMR